MSKPWGRYEIGFLGGSKFRALNANAICLWWEIKSYCDEHLNDGRFPQAIVKTFRFYSAKALEQLRRSCGVKPNGDPFAPLIDTQEIGGVPYYVMHDYLDHNDCRDAVEARQRIADERRAKERDRLKAWRERKQVKRVSTAVSSPVSETTGNGDVTLLTPTETSLSGKEHQRERQSASLSSPSRDPFTDPSITERAGRFVDRYQALYPQHRRGARYALKPTRDYAAAVTLCETWPDDRLDKLAVIFLTTDHKFAEEGSRTIPQFLALASWCDGKLSEFEHGKAAKTA